MLNAVHQGQVAIPYTPNGLNPVPNTLNTVNQGRIAMSYTPNGYNPVHNTLNAASQGQIAMPCFPNPMPKTPNLPHQVRIAMLSILNNILDDEPASNMPDAGNQGQTAIPYIQTDTN